MTSNASGPESPHHPPFHQHGDVGFCELPLEEGGKLGIDFLAFKAQLEEWLKDAKDRRNVKQRWVEEMQRNLKRAEEEYDTTNNEIEELLQCMRW